MSHDRRPPRHAAPAVGRAQHGSRAGVRAPRRYLQAAAVVSGVVLAALAGVGGTAAYLNASATVPGAKVSAGTLVLQINGATTAALGSWTPTPSTPQARALTITNAGDVPASVASQVTVTGTTLSLSTYTQLRLVTVVSAAACTSSVTGGASGAITAFPTTAVAHLDAGETKTLCAIVSLSSTAPIGSAGGTVSFTTTMTATQQVS